MTRRVAVLTDSSSDLSPVQARQYGIYLLPLTIRFAGREWLDHQELSAPEMFERMQRERIRTPPALQVPSVERYLGQVEELLSTHDEVFALHTSPRIGQVYQRAFLAARALPRQLTVFNSSTTSGGMALQAIRARQMLDQGYALTEVPTALRRIQRAQVTRICVTTLTRMRYAGMIEWARAFIGETRGLKPIVGEQEGKLEVLQVANGADAALNFLKAELEMNADALSSSQVIFASNGDRAALDELKATARHLGVREVTEVEFGAVLSSYSGPNAYGFSLEPITVPHGH